MSLIWTPAQLALLAKVVDLNGFSAAARVWIDQPSRGGERDAPRGAHEHAHPESLLEIGDRAAHGRLRHTECARRGREAIQVHDFGQQG